MCCSPIREAVRAATHYYTRVFQTLIHGKYCYIVIVGAITFALILQKFRLRLSYTCAHKSGAFALSFGVTLAPIYSQLFLGQLLVFEPRCKKIGIRGLRF